MRKQPAYNEHQLQRSFFKWLEAQHPKLYWNVFAIPNGGLRNKMVAKKLKDEGVKSGVWDVLVMLPRMIGGDYKLGMWIEFKVGYNKLTDNQKAFKEANEHNYHWVVCYDLDSAINALTNYLNGKV